MSPSGIAKLAVLLFQGRVTQAWTSALPEFPISICKPFSQTGFKPQASWFASWFSFCAWPWMQPHMFTKSKWGGAFTPVLVVFYQLISNTWSHANPLTPLAVSAHTNRNKHTETHYINCLFFSGTHYFATSPFSSLFPAPVFPCFCYLSTSSFRSIYFVPSHSLHLYRSFHALLSPILWQPHFFMSFSPSHYLHPHCSSQSLCWVEVWKPNSIKSETHRTRRSQPHKSPWV